MELLKKHFDTALESPDGVKKLRELILALAMQGKLVEQDPADQPASELLRETQAEKERLIDEGKIKRQKSPLEIKQEEIPYVIPKNWEWVRFQDINVVNSKLVSSIDYLNEYQIAPDSIEKNTGCLLSHRTVKEKGTKGPNNKFRKEQILYSKIRPSLNKAVIAPYDGLCSADMYPIDSFINRTFMLKLILSEVFLNQVRLHENRVKMPKLNLESLYQFTIPLPPLAEQKRIVKKIDQLMALCDKLEAQRKSRDEKRLVVHSSVINRLLSAAEETDFNSSWRFITRNFNALYSVKENVTELKKAILTLAMQGKLVKQDPADQPASELLKEIKAEKERLIADGKIKKQKPLPEIKPEEIPYEIPGSWEWVRFHEITFNLDSERTPLSKDARKHRDGQYDYYGASGVIDHIDDYLFNKDLLLIGEDGANLITRSKPIAFIASGKYWVNNHAHVIDSLNYALIKFLENYINSIDLKPYVTGTAQPKMNQAKLNSIFVPLPPLAEQKRIVEKIEQLMVLCDRLDEQIELSTEKQTALFDAVLAQV